MPIGSYKDSSCIFFLSFLNIINISLSIHFAAYVARRIFLSGLKVLTAFISPIVPTDIKSCVSFSAQAYFLIICATRRIFFSTSIFLASISPLRLLINISFSSCSDNGFSNTFKKKHPYTYFYILCVGHTFIAYPYNLLHIAKVCIIGT